ncbi:unnamed protein product [Arctogadus glacialis]
MLTELISKEKMRGFVPNVTMHIYGCAGVASRVRITHHPSDKSSLQACWGYVGYGERHVTTCVTEGGEGGLIEQKLRYQKFSRELAEMAGYAWALPWRTVQTGCLLSLSLGREHASGAGG